MKVNLTHKNAVIIVEIEGRFDAFGVQAVNDEFVKISEQAHPKVIVDLGRVDFIDSMALATLVKGLKRTREKQGEFALCNLQQAVLIIFELTRLDKAFKIYDSRGAALKAMQ
jgi:anti-sigma B factor antagonist